MKIKIGLKRRVPFLDKMLFAKHLAIMLHAGMPLFKAIDTLKDQTNSKRFKEILREVLARLREGESLALSLSRWQKDFGSLYIQIIRIGEESGSLEKNLEYLGDQLEKIYHLKKKIMGALMYPAIVVGATMSLGGILAFIVLPKLIPFFESLSIDLPFATKVLLFVAKTMEAYGIFILLGLVLLFFIVRMIFSRSKGFRYVVHRILLKAPIMGPIATKYNLALFARTMSILLKSGVTIVSALESTGKSINNLVFRERLFESAEEVRKGGKLSDNLERYGKLFPLVFARMVAVGEQTGRLEPTLVYLSEFYENEVDESTKNISSLIEPILLLGIGLAVSFVALAIITPIYEITQGLQK